MIHYIRCQTPSSPYHVIQQIKGTRTVVHFRRTTPPVLSNVSNKHGKKAGRLSLITKLTGGLCLFLSPDTETMRAVRTVRGTNKLLVPHRTS